MPCDVQSDGSRILSFTGDFYIFVLWYKISDIVSFSSADAASPFAAHLKDMTVRGDRVVMTEALTGNDNFDAIISASLKAGVKWHMIEQDYVFMDVFDSMRISYENLMKRYPEFRE